MNLEFLEKFCLADDREEALKQLIPGTADYYYYHCLHHEQQGEYKKVKELLDTWIGGRSGLTAQQKEVLYRKTLLQFDEDPKKALEFIRRELRLHFNHQREVEGRKTSYPTKLDVTLLEREAMKRQGYSHSTSTNLSGFSDRALDWLTREPLSPEHRRSLLQRLTRPDYPNLVEMVQADLKYKHSGGFGSINIHNWLLQSQLDELLRKNKNLLLQEKFVNAYILKLHPNPDIDWRNNPEEKQAYLDRLWTFVKDLAPAFNALKAHVFYHQLDHDRSQDIYDEKKFRHYVQMPRRVSYADPDWLKSLQEDRNRRQEIFDLGKDFSPITLFPVVSNDEALVTDYLERFFTDARDYKAYQKWILDSWLKYRFADAKILTGSGDQEKWYSMLKDPGYYQSLKDRIELKFARHNKAFFRAEEAVSLVVDVKNIESLVVKVFEVNSLNYFLATGREVDTSIDLDGLIASEETTYKYDEPPLRRVRRTFEFPALKKAGTYVVEFIGGGISSRSVVRKGSLRYLERIGAAGHVFTVLNEDNKHIPEATLWITGREYKPDDEGRITVPFSSQPGKERVLLRHGNVTTMEWFQHQSETYQFTAGIYVDREHLIKQKEAKIVVRPSLQVHGLPVSLKLVEEVGLDIRSIDRNGVESSQEVPEFELHSDKETLHTIQIPEELASITVTVRGKVRNLSRGDKVSVSDSRSFSLNGIDVTEKTEDLHLSRTADGYRVYALGKTGEARADTPVNFTFQHADFTFSVHVTLQTDEKGRIELGPLKDITNISAQNPAGTSETWNLISDQFKSVRALHACAGETLSVPTMKTPLGAKRPKGVPHEAYSLLEKNDHTFLRDRFDALDLKDGFLTLSGLEAGDYDLKLKEEGAHFVIRVTAGQKQDGWALSDKRNLKSSGSRPLQISGVDIGKEIRLKIENAGDSTRVHVTGTRLVPAYSVFHELGRMWLPEPEAIEVPKPQSSYISGRDIGDEYRYILERKNGSAYPGNMLTRPGLLLNPWAVRSTETATQDAAGGESYRGEEERAKRSKAPKPKPAPPAAPASGLFANLDFLANPSCVLVNLKPDKDGFVTFPRGDLEHASQVRVTAVDPVHTVTREFLLPEVATDHEDIRLRLGLDPDKHFTEKKQVSVLSKGDGLEIKDITTTQLETYDTLKRVYNLYTTLSGDTVLDEFGFLLRWPDLSEDEKRAKYSEFACHEMHLFLSKKDPEFFERVIKPYLKNKKDKTFMDHYLLEDDLSEFRKPWAYLRLNIVERILLAKRIEDEGDPGARHVGDLCDLLRKDIERDNHLFTTALKSGALDAEDGLGLDAAKADVMAATLAMEPAMAPPGYVGGGGAMGAQASRSAGRRAKSKKMAMKEEMLDDLMDAEMEAAPEMAMGMADEDFGEGEEIFDHKAADKDLRRRDEVRQHYQKLDKTQEWAENNYYKKTIQEMDTNLVTVNRFWRDYAAHRKGAFVSPFMAEASRNFTEMACALAVLDLPFTADKPEVKFEKATMTLKGTGSTVVYHKEIKPADPAAEKVPILVSQNYFRDDDRYRYENEERYDKYVTDEFLVHTVYTCQVVLTNPTSSPHKLDLLMQVPFGAIPVKNGFYTKGKHFHLGPYATQSVEYSFYFPSVGTYRHYPVHVSKNEELIASAEPGELKVVAKLSKVDTTSWAYISQHGDAKSVLRYMEDNNLDRLPMEKIAWRMKEMKFYEPAMALLSRRHVYNNVLWSYSIHHDDRTNIRQFLLYQEGFLRQCGMTIQSPVLDIDPVDHKWYEHLEYAPLVNARAHRLGASRRILNNRFSQQYDRMLSVVKYRKKLSPDDRLAATYYLFLQDRVEDALSMFDKADGAKVATRIQYDYLGTYVQFYREQPGAAREIATRYKDHPVDRWRKLFQNALGQLDEIEGKGAALVNDEDRDQRQAQLAATETVFDFSVESRKVTVSYQNLSDVTVNYYLMDIELLFSRQPFAEQQSSQFSFITPNRIETVKLPGRKTEHGFEIPEEYHSANVIVELVADGKRSAKAYYANSLKVRMIENYGQVRVTAGKTALPKVYVKVYARMQGGHVTFYKDGYTDLRGMFDYTSLNTNELDRVERFAVLVMSPEHGSVTHEAAPPKR